MFIYFFYTASHDTYSDLPPHVDAARMIFHSKYIYSITPQRKILVSYPLFHLCVKLIAVLLGFSSFNYEIAAAIVLTGIQLLTVWILFKNADKKRELKGTDWLLTLGLVVITALPITGKLYLPQGSPSIWHNPTYIMQKPFSLAAFFLFVEILKKEEINENKVKDFVCLACLLVLSDLSKPVFMLVFLPAAFMICLFRVIRKRCRNKKFTIGMILSVVPVICIMLYQRQLTMDSSTTTAIRFGTFLNLSVLQSVIATAAVLILPITYLYLFKGKWRYPEAIKASLLVYLFSWFEYYFLYEVEYAHGNYAWGYCMAIFILYTTIYFDLREQENSKRKKAMLMLYGFQEMCGMLYFLIVLVGGPYMV